MGGGGRTRDAHCGHHIVDPINSGRGSVAYYCCDAEGCGHVGWANGCLVGHVCSRVDREAVGGGRVRVVYGG
jgi:hypothetical protein